MTAGSPTPTAASRSRPRRFAVLGAVAVLTFAATGHGATGRAPADTARRPTAAPGPRAAAIGPVPAAGPAAACPTPPGFDCAAGARLRAAGRYVAARGGRLAVLVRDRRTGAVWRAGSTGHRDWTASTIKLAIATDLLERSRSGAIRLTPADRARLADMLATSSNPATDALWAAYGGTAADTFRRRYGMSGLVRMTTGGQHGWHAFQCTGEDLLRLAGYVLERTDPADRAYLVHALRTVAADQRWGVWSAGPGLRPGNKDGWAVKPGPHGWHAVTHSVGFAGPGERYAVVVTDSLPPGVPMDTGVREVSEVVALAFGAPPPEGLPHLG